jgi:dihydropteroate synthase
MRISWGSFSLDLALKTAVMGILNVTPDSFSDGGKFFDKTTAVDHALRMVDDGADIIDVGGLSTRPGSAPVEVEEEIRRAVPAIESIAAKVDVPVSIDTYRADVARRAIDAGASMINDISGLRFDHQMAEVAAKADVPVIVMHIKGTPRDMQKTPTYEALIPEILDYLRESIRVARDAGIKHVFIDPGIGFGKTFDHNLEIIHNIREFTKLGYPVLVGPSRKAFIGEILGGAPADDRLEGTAAVVTACVLGGAHVVRVHDVKEMARVVRVADAIVRERVDGEL